MADTPQTIATWLNLVISPLDKLDKFFFFSEACAETLTQLAEVRINVDMYGTENNFLTFLGQRGTLSSNVEFWWA